MATKLLNGLIMSLCSQHGKIFPGQKVQKYNHKLTLIAFDQWQKIGSIKLTINPTLLIIRDIQIKTTIRYHFTLVRMAIIKKSTNKKMLERVWTKGNPTLLLAGIYIGTATMENSMEVP